MALFDNTFGIEIECYLPDGGSAAQAAAAITARGVPCTAETYNHQVRGHWKIVTDGSLDDYTRGVEVVSPVLQGEAGLAAVDTVMEALNDYGCTVSRKCGLHVHVGAGRSDMGFFKSLLKLYAFYEPVIDGFMPPSRRRSDNLYCRSMTSVTLPAIDRAADLDALINLLTTRTEEQRYYKLNLAAYRRYRTVEFRQHSGTLDARKAQNWIRFCLRMVEAAKAGRTALGAPASTAQANTARRGSKSWQVGQMMLRPEGVTGPEAMAATGWPSISLPQQARACGISYTTQRTGREVRYFAQATAASTTATATLQGLLETLGCDDAERAYFRARTANLSGPVRWEA